MTVFGSMTEAGCAKWCKKAKSHLESAGHFADFECAGVDAQGRAVFFGEMETDDPHHPYQTGVFAERNGAIVAVLHVGVQAPACRPM